MSNANPNTPNASPVSTAKGLFSKAVAFVKNSLKDEPDTAANLSGQTASAGNAGNAASAGSNATIKTGSNYHQMIDLIVNNTILYVQSKPTDLNDTLQVQIKRISIEIPRALAYQASALTELGTEMLRVIIQDRIRKEDPQHKINLDEFEPVVFATVDQLSVAGIDGEDFRIYVDNDPTAPDGLTNTIALTFNSKTASFNPGKTRAQLAAEFVAKQTNKGPVPRTTATQAANTLFLRIGSPTAPEQAFNTFPLTIGKAPDAGVKVSGNGVSGSHAIIDALPDGRLAVADDSTYGTWLNKQKLTRQPQGKAELLGGTGQLDLGALGGAGAGLTVYYRQQGAVSATGIVREVTQLLPSAPPSPTVVAGAGAGAPPPLPTQSTSSTHAPAKPAAVVVGVPAPDAIVTLVVKQTDSLPHLKLHHHHFTKLPERLTLGGVMLAIVQREGADSFVVQSKSTLTLKGQPQGPMFIWQAKPTEIVGFPDGTSATLELGAAA
jgi:FHA domain